MAFHRNALLFVVLLPASVQLASATIVVPAGFEDLAKTQRLWTEVSLYGASLGLFEADITLETVTFVAPETLIAAIKRQFNDDPALIASVTGALSSPLARNGNLACSSNGSAAGCDFIDTKSVALIYDENNARINLFFDRRYLPKQTAENQWYQPTRNTENALIHQQNINFVADEDYQSMTVQGNGSLAMTENGYFNLDWTWLGQRSRHQQQQEITVNNAWFRQDLWHEYYVQLGEMDTRDLFSAAGGNINLSQLPLGKIRGLRTGSTRAWINPVQQSSGTPITVLLSHDARIDARRGNQLLASFYLNAGAQTLDTRSFPDGSYTVTLAIYENNRLTRTEQVPFTRTGITPFDRVEWFMQAGETDNDDMSDERSAVAQAGIRLPVTSTLAITSGATVKKNQRFVESAVDWSRGFNTGPIDGVLSTRFSYLYGSQGQRGNIQQISYNDGFSLSFYRNALSADNCDSSSTGFDAVNGCYRSLSVMFSVPVGSWYANLGYSDNRNEGRYVSRRELPNSDDRHDNGLPWESVYMTRSRSQAWQAGLSNAFSSSGNYSSTLALSRSGLWFGRWGDGRPASAIAVNVATPEASPDSRIAVSLDNSGSADIPANARALFALPGYQQTTLTINESTDISHGANSEITQGSGSRTVFMVPGKMLHREVQTTTRYTWLGQLTDEQHTPFIGGMPLNVSGWSDLGNGGFSAESDSLIQSLYLVKQQQFYQCALKVKTMRDVVRYVGTVTCEELTYSALPETVQQQAQLLLAGRTPAVSPTAMNNSTLSTGK